MYILPRPPTKGDEGPITAAQCEHIENKYSKTVEGIKDDIEDTIIELKRLQKRLNIQRDALQVAEVREKNAKKVTSVAYTREDFTMRKVFLYGSNHLPANSKEETCVVCQDSGSKQVITECGHIYHKECLHNLFLSGDRFCPCCRIYLCSDNIMNKSRAEIACISRMKKNLFLKKQRILLILRCLVKFMKNGKVVAAKRHDAEYQEAKYQVAKRQIAQDLEVKHLATVRKAIQFDPKIHPSFFRTKYCRYGSRCHRGINCWFAHCPEEVRPIDRTVMGTGNKYSDRHTRKVLLQPRTLSVFFK